MKYRKKPIVIEAIKWDGTNLLCWLDKRPEVRKQITIENAQELTIKTLEGDMKASIGDYIIIGIKGEVYPCKSDIFEASYEHVPLIGERIPRSV